MKPPRLLLVVQDTFFIAGRGLIPWHLTCTSDKQFQQRFALS